MKLRQLREKDAEERACVDKEMYWIIFCVETGKNIPAGTSDVNINITSM